MPFKDKTPIWSIHAFALAKDGGQCLVQRPSRNKRGERVGQAYFAHASEHNTRVPYNVLKHATSGIRHILSQGMPLIARDWRWRFNNAAKAPRQRLAHSAGRFCSPPSRRCRSRWATRRGRIWNRKKIGTSDYFCHLTVPSVEEAAAPSWPCGVL